MKRILPIAVVVASAQLAAEELPMEHVLVSVPLHKSTAETALPVTVLSGDELRRAAASTIGQTLDSKPGLANASFGPGVGQPVIRGQQGARVTVLQNGTSSADASNLSADHAVSVEPLLADSIEVLRGPSTLLYGGGAIGGVVNVLDNRIPTSLDEGSGGVEYRHDTASSGDNVVARYDGSSGQFAFHADALYRDWDDLEIPGYAREEHHEDDHDEDHHEDEDHDDHEEHEDEEQRRGVLDNSGGRTKSLTLGGSYHFDDGFFGLAVSRLENEYGIPAGAHGGHGDEHDEDHDEDHDDDHDEDHDDHDGDHDGDHDEDHDEHEHGDITLDVEQTRYDAALHLHQFAGLEVMRGFLTYTDYEHAEIEGSGEIGTLYSNESWEGRLEAVHQPFGNFHGVFGVQALTSEFSALGEEAFIPVTDSTETGLFLVEDYHADNWTFELGLRYDHDERDPDTSASGKKSFNAFSASGAALWNVSPGWQFGVALSRAERAPAIEELFSNVEAMDEDELVEHAATAAIEIGDPSLDTEISENVDLSVDWSGERMFVNVSVFYNDFTDYIGLVSTGEEVDEVPVYQYQQQDARFYGIEVDSEFTLAELGGGDLKLGLFGDGIRGELDDNSQAPRLPPVRVGSRLSWSSDMIELWASVLDAADQERPGANEESTEGYTRWDLGGEYRIPIASSEMVAFVNFKNITDEEIRLSTSFLREVAPEAGRSVEAGFRFTF